MSFLCLIYKDCTTAMISNKNIGGVLSSVGRRVALLKPPVISMLALNKHDPFRILIATVLSARTKDSTTLPAATRLFEKADSPIKLLQLQKREIQKLIFPVGFYRQKARHLIEISRILLKKFSGKVPDDLDTLLTLPGVGRKTANLVIAKAYNKPALCVDTHVHRISNRFGYVSTKTPQQTETALRNKLPRKYWATYNDLLVAYGQSICVPVSPWCSKCVVKNLCPKRHVKRSR